MEREGIIEPHVTPAAMNFLTGFPWPGNIRQLRNFIERLMIIRQDDLIDFNIVRPMRTENNNHTIPVVNTPQSLQDARDEFEKDYTLQVLH